MKKFVEVPRLLHCMSDNSNLRTLTVFHNQKRNSKTSLSNYEILFRQCGNVEKHKMLGPESRDKICGSPLKETHKDNQMKWTTEHMAMDFSTHP